MLIVHPESVELRWRVHAGLTKGGARDALYDFSQL
jgi:hypothetical protein